MEHFASKLLISPSLHLSNEQLTMLIWPRFYLVITHNYIELLLTLLGYCQCYNLTSYSSHDIAVCWYTLYIGYITCYHVIINGHNYCTLCENLMIIYDDVAYTAHVIAYSISAASFWWCCNTVRWAWLAWGLSGWLTTLLQCFDTVGWVIRPVKTVGRITYIVLVQTLNHAQSINLMMWDMYKKAKLTQIGWRATIAQSLPGCCCQTVFGEFKAKNLASSSNNLQELFRKWNIKLGGGTGWPCGSIGHLTFMPVWRMPLGKMKFKLVCVFSQFFAFRVMHKAILRLSVNYFNQSCNTVWVCTCIKWLNGTTPLRFVSHKRQMTAIIRWGSQSHWREATCITLQTIGRLVGS